MKLISGAVFVCVILAAAFFLSFSSSNVAVSPVTGAGVAGVATSGTNGTAALSATSSASSSPLLREPEAPQPAPNVAIASPADGNDIAPQPKLADPPPIIKGIYLTAWVAGSPGRVQSIINLLKSTGLNAVVIDLKDYSGYVSYAMDVPQVKTSGAEGEIRIARPNALIKELHDNGIYVIGRITDFQDSILAQAHPEWALHNKTTGGIWEDNSGLAWMDPAATPAWDYLAAIANDAFGRGFDEIQFDYIRFASDGSLGNITYPYWDGKTPMAAVIADYFKFLRSQFPNEKISADLFGLSTINNDDLGIGQVIQSAYEYFDYVSPMVYPSHYASGFLGYKSPAAYPYQVIDYSLTHAVAKLVAMGNSNSTVAVAASATTGTASSTATSSSAATARTTATSTTTTSAKAAAYSPFNLGYIPPTKLRPWLQDFDLYGVPYTPQMVALEKHAVYDTLDTTTTSQYYGGWLLWDAANNYTAADLGAE